MKVYIRTLFPGELPTLYSKEGSTFAGDLIEAGRDITPELFKELIEAADEGQDLLASKVYVPLQEQVHEYLKEHCHEELTVLLWRQPPYLLMYGNTKQALCTFHVWSGPLDTLHEREHRLYNHPFQWNQYESFTPGDCYHAEL